MVTAPPPPPDHRFLIGVPLRAISRATRALNLNRHRRLIPISTFNQLVSGMLLSQDRSPLLIRAHTLHLGVFAIYPHRHPLGVVIIVCRQTDNEAGDWVFLFGHIVKEPVIEPVIQGGGGGICGEWSRCLFNKPLWCTFIRYGQQQLRLLPIYCASPCAFCVVNRTKNGWSLLLHHHNIDWWVSW